MASKRKRTKVAQVRDHLSTSRAHSSSPSHTLSIPRPENIPPSTSQGRNESQSMSHAVTMNKGAPVRDHTSTSRARSSSPSHILNMTRLESIPPSTNQRGNESQSISHAVTMNKGAQVRDHSSTSRARSSSPSRTLSMPRPESIPPSTNQGGNESQSISHAGSNEGTSSSVRRGRSSAKPWAGWGNGEIKILVWNELCQPISKNRYQLATQLGYFARQGHLFPLDAPTWKHMKQHDLDTIWENVQHNTNAPHGYKEICLSSIGASWKKFKNTIKSKYYNAYETDEERLSHLPPLVSPTQWENLVAYWGTEEAQRIAAQNAENRSHLCAHPRTGRKPFVIFMEECKEKNMPVDKLSVFRGTRKGKDGNYNEDDGAAEIEENIKKRLEDYSLEEQNDLEVRNKIFEEVVGQDGHGRALCMGTGIRPAPKRSRASSSSDKNLEVEIAQIREEAEEERIRHKEELEQVFNKSKEYVNEMLRRAGLSIPDDAIDTSSQP